MKVKWTKEEEKYISDNYKIQSKKDIGLHLNKTTRSVQRKCIKMELKCTKKDNSFIISNGMKKMFKLTGKKWNRRVNGHTPSEKYSKNNTYDTTLYNIRDRKLKLLYDLGGKCISCGIDDPFVLQFDHIENDGYKYNHISLFTQIDHNLQRFQILCANCNLKKALFYRELKRLERVGIPPF